MNEALNDVLQHPRIWRASQAQRNTEQGIPTGFAELDAQLAGGGWPTGALTEILYPHEGVGELQLLMPALARLSQQPRWITWIAPPHVPYAPALAAHGIALSRVLVVHPDNELDALWAIEQALRAGTCAAVLAWVKYADDRSLRRLQLAAEEGNTWGILFRSQYSVVQTSPAALRLRVEPTSAAGLNVQILKRRGGWPTGPLFLDLAKEEKQSAGRRMIRAQRSLIEA